MRAETAPGLQAAAPAAAPMQASLALGPMLVAPVTIDPRVRTHQRAEDGPQGGMVALHFLREDGLIWQVPAPARRCRAGDAVVSGAGRSWSFAAEAPIRAVALLAPRAFLEAALPGRLTNGVLERSTPLALVARFLDEVLALDADALGAASRAKLALALRELLAAVFAPTAQPPEALALRRDATLLERATRHIDAHLGAPLDIASLCAALRCSRSTLYRAAMPSGGVAELIARRRLVAIHGRLRDPDERRAIARLARDHGFADPIQFSRRFKRAFGTTAGQVRALGTARPDAHPLGASWIGGAENT